MEIVIRSILTEHNELIQAAQKAIGKRVKRVPTIYGLTLDHTVNYGSCLQAYALQHVIENMVLSNTLAFNPVSSSTSRFPLRGLSVPQSKP